MLPTGLPSLSPAPRALPALRDDPPGPAERRTGLARGSTWASPPDTPRTRGHAWLPPSPPHGTALPHPGTALGPHLTPTLQGAAPVSPRSPCGRAWLSASSVGRRRALPAPPQGAVPGFPLLPLTAARPVRARSPHGSMPGSALPPPAPHPVPGPLPLVAHRGRPCLPSRRLATPSPQHHRSPQPAPCRSNQQQDGDGRGGGAPALAVIATAPSKTRPDASCGNQKPSPALRGRPWERR